MSKGLFGGGDGTQSKPFLIEDARDLYQVRNHPSSYFKLVTNINLGEPPYNEKNGWEPIENFTGVFDGNKKRIFNLTINRPGEDYVGLFKTIDITASKKTAIIYDLCMERVNIIGAKYVGAVVGGITGISDTYAVNTEASALFSRICIDGYIEGEDCIGSLCGIIRAENMNTQKKTVMVCKDCEAHTNLSISNADNGAIAQFVGIFTDKWSLEAPAQFTYQQYLRSVGQCELSASSKKPTRINNFVYDLHKNVTYTSCYINSEIWDTFDDGSDLIKLTSSEIIIPDNTDLLIGAYTDGQNIWARLDEEEPRLMFCTVDNFFICADKEYFYYDFTAKQFKSLGTTVPIRVQAIEFGNKRLYQIPTTAWSKFKTGYTNIQLINFIDKADTTTQTSQELKLTINNKYSEMNDNDKKEIFTKKISFNTKYGNISTVTGW